MQVILLEFMTGALSQGVYSDLAKAQLAYRTHCECMQTEPQPWVERFPGVWHVADTPDGAITGTVATRITVDEFMPFV